MALTTATLALDGSVVAVSPGRYKDSLYKVTFDTSYPTGGYAITASMFGLGEAIVFADPGPTTTGRTVLWDAVNSKLKIFNSQGTEVPNATNLSAEFSLVQVFGL